MRPLKARRFAKPRMTSSSTAASLTAPSTSPKPPQIPATRRNSHQPLAAPTACTPVTPAISQWPIPSTGSSSRNSPQTFQKVTFTNTNALLIEQGVLFQTEKLLHLITCEEITDLKLGRILRVRAVNRILADRRRILLADRALVGLRRIRRTHQRTQISNGVLLLEHHRHNR